MNKIENKQKYFFTDKDGLILNYQAFQKKLILFVLTKTGGNITTAADLLGMPRSTLVGKMKKLGL